MSQNDNWCINNIINTSKEESMSILDTKYEFQISKPLQKYPIWYYFEKVETKLDTQYHSEIILCIQTSIQKGFKIPKIPKSQNPNFAIDNPLPSPFIRILLNAPFSDRNFNTCRLHPDPTEPQCRVK